MPGCAAVGCNNRSEKGYTMKCFPRDPELRKIWKERVARADWEPSNNSFLCQVHFASHEWFVTQSGKYRLKKNAVPTIFNITSTRKSPKKKLKPIVIKQGIILQNQYTVHCVVNNIENSSGNSMSQDIKEEPSAESAKDTKLWLISKPFVANEKIHSNYQEDDIIVISDDSLEPSLNDSKEGSQLLIYKNPVGANVKEIKEEIMDHNTLDDSYDEIEEKLKQICDGGSSEDENYNDENKKILLNKNSQQSKEKSDIDCDANNVDSKVTFGNTNHNLLSKEISHILTNKQKNVEIIFGKESGDEKTPVCMLEPGNKYPVAKIENIHGNALDYNEIICVKNERKVFSEDIEENFTRDEVHVIPNIRAAMKRKRRTREEIMKFIKKSIKSTSDHDANSSSNSDMSESAEQETEDRNELPTSLQQLTEIRNDDASTDTDKFVIKVSGNLEDVSEIMEELSSNAINTKISQNFSTPYKEQEDSTFVTSVITVLSSKSSKEGNDNLNSLLVKDEYSRKKAMNSQSPFNERELTRSDSIQSLGQCQSTCFGHNVSWSDEEDKNQTANISPKIQTCSHNVPVSCAPCNCEVLLERVKIQEDVIAKLTDQLVIYKELENNFRMKHLGYERDAEIASPRINTRSSNVQSTVVSKKNLESKQRLIDDLSNRVNYFEEMNKKLMKTVTLESQQKRKLEGQLKQKDNRIKELNWKLEKASKYLERAEKNTNTYRRKMLNMQTIMRRRKLLDENMSRFNEMLIDSSRQEYSEKALAMAVQIRKTCGRIGYDKLLSYGFPLPPLPALRKLFWNDEMTNHNENNIDRMRNVRTTSKAGKIVSLRKSDVEMKDLEHSDSKATECDGTETVTGTVQDIFDENNDGDDFNTTELREHFILQLNAVI